MAVPDNSAARSAKADGCRGFQSISAVTRRSALRVGSAFGIGLTLPELLRRQAEAAPAGGSFGKVRGVIMLYLHGGHPQQETFDPKPNGPSAVKGEFGAISACPAFSFQNCYRDPPRSPISSRSFDRCRTTIRIT